MVYYEGAYIHWLKFLCRGKQSLRLKRFLVPNLLGEMGDSWARNEKSRMSLGHLHARREGGTQRMAEKGLVQQT